MESGRNASKTRNWAFVVYPESAPENWQGMLADTHMAAFISPLHDRDVDEETGELKKPHWHIVIMTDGPITQKRANELIEPYNGTKSAEYIMSLRGYVRYLAHLDDPDKAQYDPAEIIALGGADLADMLRLSQDDKYKLIGDIFCYCKENEIFELWDLTSIAIEKYTDWLPVIVEKTYFFNHNLHSLRHSKRR